MTATDYTNENVASSAEVKKSTPFLLTDTPTVDADETEGLTHTMDESET
jgi:hypothetical protein